MKFIDQATLADPESNAVAGLAYTNDDRTWLVAASTRGPDPEWFVWQRAVPGDRRATVQGYVRRLAWCRFTERAEAMLMAGVLDDLPATASTAVVRASVASAVRQRVTDPLRDLKTRLVFRAVRAVLAAAKASRERVGKP